MHSKTSTKLNLSYSLKRSLLLLANIHYFEKDSYSYNLEPYLLELIIDSNYEIETKNRIATNLRLYFKNETNQDEISKLLHHQNAKLRKCVQQFTLLFDQLPVPDTNVDEGIKIDPKNNIKLLDQKLVYKASGTIAFRCDNDSWKPNSYDGIFRIKSYEIEAELFEKDLINLIEIRTKKMLLEEMLERIEQGEPIFEKRPAEKYPDIIISFMKEGINDMDEIIKLAQVYYDFGKVSTQTVRKGLRQAFKRIFEAKT